MHTRKGYSENWTVVMKSSDASVSKLTSTPALMKSRSTVTFPVTTKAALNRGRATEKEAFNDCGAIVRFNSHFLSSSQVGELHYGLFLDADPHYLRLDVRLQEPENKTGAKHNAGVSPVCWWNN